jgi:hypothetical protein
LARFTFLLMDYYSLFFLVTYGLCLSKYVILLLFRAFNGPVVYLEYRVRNAEVRSSTLLYSTNKHRSYKAGCAACLFPFLRNLLETYLPLSLFS